MNSQKFAKWLVKFYQIDEISPNLVTLAASNHILSSMTDPVVEISDWLNIFKDRDQQREKSLERVHSSEGTIWTWGGWCRGMRTLPTYVPYYYITYIGSFF